MKKSIKIILVIIATLVGAGFASGKEIYTFFFIYGKVGVAGIIISNLIISLIIYKVIKICNENNIHTYQNFCNIIVKSNKLENNYSTRVKLVELLNSTVNIFLLTTFFIMISGFSSLLHQAFSINKFLASAIITGICYQVFLKNVKGLINISNYLVPILIFYIIYISTRDINAIGNDNSIFSEHITIYKGLIDSVLYACYNCIILIPTLISLKGEIENNKNIKFISIISFILLTVLSFSICNLLSQGDSRSYILEMPIIGIVQKYGKVNEVAYISIIGVSIFTSAISTGCGFLNNCDMNGKKYKRNTRIMCTSAIFLSQASFSTLVNVMYPILGIFGLIEVSLIMKNIKK